MNSTSPKRLARRIVTIADKAVLVTGANRGIGQALVEEALRRGAKRVYEGTRRPIFDGVEKSEEDIFPDPMSESMAESWRNSAAKAMERQNAALVEAEPVKS
jgi:NAD(P)-dependent dehydrogenase (short-subunit alcohol dehydrogenase family)